MLMIIQNVSSIAEGAHTLIGTCSIAREQFQKKKKNRNSWWN